MSPIDVWAAFLANERLTPCRVQHPMVLVRLCEELAKGGMPRCKPYPERLKTRLTVAQTAIGLGIDLAALKFHGKLAMGRGLLDVWNAVYAKQFGSSFGTAGWKEDKRRFCKSIP